MGKYCFVISKDATKSKVARAVEKLFSVQVEKVNISYAKGKEKFFKRKKGFRSGFKKAIVTTKDKKKIDFARGV